MILPRKRQLLAGMAACGLILSISAACQAESGDKNKTDNGSFDDGKTISIVWENDSFNGIDRHYTNGMRLSFATGERAPGTWAYETSKLVSDAVFPDTLGKARNRLSIAIGQSIFTPENLFRVRPDPRDRPYAGWAYVEGSLYRDTGSVLDRLGITIGIVGPEAGGEEAQNWWHKNAPFAFFRSHRANGWDAQLVDEPGLVITEERKWRFDAPLADGLSVELLPEVGAAVGNVFTYLSAGAVLRVGQYLRADWGQPAVQPGLSGSDFVNRSKLGQVGWYLFAGTQLRLVGRNIFLDGNTFDGDPSVDKEPLVVDFTAGFSALLLKRFRFSLSYTRRTEEFVGQTSDDEIGAIRLSGLF